MLSAPRPLRSTRPDTKIPTDQLVKIRLQKNAISGSPIAKKLKSKKNSASSVIGMTPIASRIRLMIISEIRNSIGFNGLIIRLPRLRAHISSRNEIEKPSWPRNRMSHRITAPISVPPARAKKLSFCEM